jgi:hypothetical protein
MATDLGNTVPTAAIRGPVLTFKGDPFKMGLEHAMVYETDAIVAFGDGVITHFGPAIDIAPKLPAGLQVSNYGPDALISAGFLDSHVHFSANTDDRRLRRAVARLAQQVHFPDQAQIFRQDVCKLGRVVQTTAFDEHVLAEEKADLG